MYFVTFHHYQISKAISHKFMYVVHIKTIFFFRFYSTRIMTLICDGKSPSVHFCGLLNMVEKAIKNVFSWQQETTCGKSLLVCLYHYIMIACVTQNEECVHLWTTGCYKSIFTTKLVFFIYYKYKTSSGKVLRTSNFLFSSPQKDVTSLLKFFF